MKRILSLLMASTFLFSTGCSSSSETASQSSDYATTNTKSTGGSDGETIKVVTTIFPEYDWVKQIVGDTENIEITLLLENGVDLHSFQPTIDDMVTISTSDLFIHVGGVSDSWMDDVIAEAVNKDIQVINLVEVLGDSVKMEESVIGMNGTLSADGEVIAENLEECTDPDCDHDHDDHDHDAEECTDPDCDHDHDDHDHDAEECTDPDCDHDHDDHDHDAEECTDPDCDHDHDDHDHDAEECTDLDCDHDHDHDAEECTDPDCDHDHDDHDHDAEECTDPDCDHDHDDHDHEAEECTDLDCDHDHDHDAEDCTDHDHSSHSHEDEHVWLSLKNAKVLCSAIADTLSAIAPSEADNFQENLTAYLAELDALDKEYVAAVDASAQKTILLADRFPFRYLVDDYNITYYAAFSGCSAETEASFATITFLAQKLDELGLDTILTIENPTHTIAETVIANSTAKNQSILVLDSMQATTSSDINSGVTYLGVMQNNLQVLKEVLK